MSTPLAEPPPAASAAAASMPTSSSGADLLSQLRDATSDCATELDASTGQFYLEMCEGNVEQAAALYREQQPPARTAPAPAPRTSSASITGITTSSSAGGRKRAKAKIADLSSLVVDNNNNTTRKTTSSHRAGSPQRGATEPGGMGMSHSTSSARSRTSRGSSSSSHGTGNTGGGYAEPTVGLVKGRRDRGFANHAELLGDAAHYIGIPAAYSYDGDSYRSLASNISCSGGGAKPGAFNETYAAGPLGEFVVQTPRVKASSSELLTAPYHRQSSLDTSLTGIGLYPSQHERRGSSASTLTAASIATTTLDYGEDDDHHHHRDSLLSQSATSWDHDLEEETTSAAVDVPPTTAESQQDHSSGLPATSTDGAIMAEATPQESQRSLMTSSSRNSTDHQKDSKGSRVRATRPGVVSVRGVSTTTNTPTEPGLLRSATAEPVSVVTSSDPGLIRSGTQPASTSGYSKSGPGKVRHTPATAPGAVSVKDAEPLSQEPQSPVTLSPRMDASSGSHVSSSSSSLPALPQPKGKKKNRHNGARRSLEDSVTSIGSSHPSPSGKVRHTLATHPGAVSVSTTERSSELKLPLLDESSVSNASSRPLEKVRLSASATTPGAVSVVASEPGTLDNLRNSLTQQQTMDASSSILVPAGKMRHSSKTAVRPGVVSVSAEGEEQDVSSSLQNDAKAGRMGRRNKGATQPGAVNMTSDKEEDRTQTKSNKFGLGRAPVVVTSDDQSQNGTAKPGAVNMTTDKEEDRTQTKSNKFRLGPAPAVVTSDKGKESQKARKDDKAGKKLDTAVPKLAPGAVSVKVSGDQTTAEEEIGNGNDPNTDPSLEATSSADSAGASNLLPIPTTLPKPSGRRRGKGHAPPKAVRSDPVNQLRNAPVHGGPRSSYSSDATGITSPKKKGFFGFLKKSKK